MIFSSLSTDNILPVEQCEPLVPTSSDDAQAHEEIESMDGDAGQMGTARTDRAADEKEGEESKCMWNAKSHLLSFILYLSLSPSAIL